MITYNFLKKFCVERNIKNNTHKGYVSAINKYIEFHNKDLNFLIEEARLDEENNLLLKNRKLKKRLLSFRNYLFTTNLSNNTVKTYLSRIKTFYRHYEIEIPELPPAKYNQEYETNYSDIPTKSDIKKALEISPLKMQALILFMSSSGTAKAETLSLSVNDFLLAISEYIENIDDINYTLKQLKNKNIIPTFYIKRQKTNKYYYTFCSNEATKKIIKYLLSRKTLNKDDKLFPVSDSYVINTFQKINDAMGWGFRGKYRYFRSHSLRKFHASNISLSAEYVDMLQGRSKSSIHEAYIKTNPERLKKIYKNAMHNILIYTKKANNCIDIQENINITINIFISDCQYNLIE